MVEVQLTTERPIAEEIDVISCLEQRECGSTSTLPEEFTLGGFPIFPTVSSVYVEVKPEAGVLRSPRNCLHDIIPEGEARSDY